MAHSELAKERAGAEEAVARASKAERELDQARARAAVLDNKLAVSLFCHLFIRNIFGVLNSRVFFFQSVLKNMCLLCFWRLGVGVIACCCWLMMLQRGNLIRGNSITNICIQVSSTGR